VIQVGSRPEKAGSRTGATGASVRPDLATAALRRSADQCRCFAYRLALLGFYAEARVLTDRRADGLNVACRKWFTGIVRATFLAPPATGYSHWRTTSRSSTVAAHYPGSVASTALRSATELPFRIYPITTVWSDFLYQNGLFLRRDMIAAM
jgi:hypothetical protein